MGPATESRTVNEEVDLEIVWNLVVFDVPDLVPKIVAALDEFKSE